jgi:hypothetical protein
MDGSIRECEHRTGIGAGWYDLAGKILWPTIPLPEGDRVVLIETQNSLTNEPELRVARDFLEWRRELRSIEDLGAYRAATRNLIVGDAPPLLILTAELTAAAFRAARVPPLLGRGLLDADETPGAPGVVVLAHEVWQRALGGRRDVIGSVARLGSTPATVVGVMPEGFGYPFNHRAWTPLHCAAIPQHWWLGYRRSRPRSIPACSSGKPSHSANGSGGGIST